MKDSKYNLAIFGHAKHGKSTLGGRLAYEFGAVSKVQLKRFEEKSAKFGKDFNKFNYIFLQRNPAVWQKEKDTIGDSSRTSFPEFSNINVTDKSRLTLVDTPGHRDYISNLIYGAYLADQAILTIAANTGIEDVTIEVIKSLISFDVPILSIVVTKMDIVNYSENIYLDIIDELRELLETEFSLSLKQVCQNIIPISALKNIGITRVNDEINWYKGDTLIDSIKGNKFYKVNEESKSRFIVEGAKDIYNVESVGVVVVGTLETGTLKKDDKLILEPASTIENKTIEYKIKSIQNAKSVTDIKIDEDSEKYEARSILSILFSSVSYYELKKQLKRGGIFGISRCRVARRIVADINFFKDIKVYQGQEFILHSNASYTLVRLKKFDQSVSNKKRDVVECELELVQPIAMESKEVNQQLSKFILRKDKSVIGCGICKTIVE